jgi:phosphopantetheine--protein transferase-like protein
MLKKSGSFLSLGIDLVEFKKAKTFYGSHQTNLRTFFTRGEINQIRRNKNPHKKLAVILAAKEAVFKAISPDGKWLGFTDITILAGPQRDVRFRLGRRFHPTSRRLGWKLECIQKKDFVIASCRPVPGGRI